MSQYFYNACESGDLAKIEVEIAKGVDVNWANIDQSTSLLNAAWKGRDAVVQRLLQHPGINVNIANTSGFTALHAACYQGNANILGMLLAAKGQNSYNEKSNNTSIYPMQTPIMVAVSQNKLECVKLMVDVEEVDLETRDSQGRGLEELAR